MVLIPIDWLFFVLIFALSPWIDLLWIYPRKWYRTIPLIKESKENTIINMTILVVCRNKKDRIAKFLDTILQTEFCHERLEIIVINDGSTDGSQDIIKKETTKDTPIILYNLDHKESGLGVNFALNNAIINYVLEKSIFKKTNNHVIGIVDIDIDLPPTLFDDIQKCFSDRRIGSVGVSFIPLLSNRFFDIIQRLYYIDYVIGYQTNNQLRGYIYNTSEITNKIGFFQRSVIEHTLATYQKVFRNNLINPLADLGALCLVNGWGSIQYQINSSSRISFCQFCTDKVIISWVRWQTIIYRTFQILRGSNYLSSKLDIGIVFLETISIPILFLAIIILTVLKLTRIIDLYVATSMWIVWGGIIIVSFNIFAKMLNTKQLRTYYFLIDYIVYTGFIPVLLILQFVSVICALIISSNTFIKPVVSMQSTEYRTPPEFYDANSENSTLDIQDLDMEDPEILATIV